jgi:hypothetical protein
MSICLAVRRTADQSLSNRERGQCANGSESSARSGTCQVPLLGGMRTRSVASAIEPLFEPSLRSLEHLAGASLGIGELTPAGRIMAFPGAFDLVNELLHEVGMIGAMLTQVRLAQGSDLIQATLCSYAHRQPCGEESTSHKGHLKKSRQQRLGHQAGDLPQNQAEDYAADGSPAVDDDLMNFRAGGCLF